MQETGLRCTERSDRDPGHIERRQEAYHVTTAIPFDDPVSRSASNRHIFLFPCRWKGFPKNTDSERCQALFAGVPISSRGISQYRAVLQISLAT